MPQTLKLNQPFHILEGDCLLRMAELADGSVDAVVTDPPYGLSQQTPEDVQAAMELWTTGKTYTHDKTGFLDLAWDSFVPGPEVWREAYRVLKPGGYIAAFSATRTLDLMATSLVLGGFEPVDVLAWCFASGYPKSLNIAQAIDRMGGRSTAVWDFTAWLRSTGVKASDVNRVTNSFMASHYLTKGSQPAIPSADHWAKIKTLLTDVVIPPEMEDMVTSKVSRNVSDGSVSQNKTFLKLAARPRPRHEPPPEIVSELGKKWEGWGTGLKPAWEPIALMRKPGMESFPLKGPRFFFCGKASRKDRDEGVVLPDDFQDHPDAPLRKNFHPTVKPTALMKWLCELTTPKGGLILDPFMGSGSTGKAAVSSEFHFVGVERNTDFVGLSRGRIQFAVREPVQDAPLPPVLSFFDL